MNVKNGLVKKLLLPSAVIVGSVLAAAGIMATAPEVTPTAPQIVPTSVRTMTVEPHPIQLKVKAQGTVLPNTESNLISEVPGRIVWMAEAMNAGGFINQGEVLLRLENKDAANTRERAEAAVKRTQAELEHARFEHERISSLANQKLISQSQLENTVRLLKVAEAARQDAQANFEQSERDFQRTEIQAPFTGVVRQKSVDVGQYLQKGTPIATLYANDAVEVRLPIADRQLAYLNLPLDQLNNLPPDAQPAVTIRAEFAGQKMLWEGRVVRTEAQIDLSSRMVHLIARVDNSTDGMPLTVGLFVDATIEGLKVDDTVSLPRSALRNGNRLLIVSSDNTLHYRAVEPFRLYEDQVLLRSGLKAGERICISPIQTVVEGMSVTPIDNAG